MENRPSGSCMRPPQPLFGQFHNSTMAVEPSTWSITPLRNRKIGNTENGGFLVHLLRSSIPREAETYIHRLHSPPPNINARGWMWIRCCRIWWKHFCLLNFLPELVVLKTREIILGGLCYCQKDDAQPSGEIYDPDKEDALAGRTTAVRNLN